MQRQASKPPREPLVPFHLQVFVANGQQIRGMTRKGKEFFKVITNLTEVIQNMYVEDTKIWTSTWFWVAVVSAVAVLVTATVGVLTTAGELIYNLFENGKDVGFFMAPDVIYSFCVRRITRWGAGC